MYVRSVSRIAAICLLLLVFPASAAADGAVDPSFGNGGVVAFAPQQFSVPFGAALDAQGRILVGAMLEDGSRVRTRAAVLRLLPDGSLDPSFGSGGVATIAPPPPYLTLNPSAMVLDSQGRVVITGQVDDDIPVVVRVLQDGTLDGAFASGGILVARGAYGGLPAYWSSIALDGTSIVVAGADWDDPPPYGAGVGWTAVIARIGDNGVPDPAFASGGFLALPLPGSTFSGPNAVALDHSGRIVLGITHRITPGLGEVSASVVRISPAGSLDATFGDGSIALGSGTRGAPSIRVTARGEIIVVGGWSATPGAPAAMVARLRPGGQLDRTFGSNGQIAADRSGGAASSSAILDCQGDLLLASDGGLRRYGPDGRLDPTFHATGIPRIPVGATTAVPGLAPWAFAPGGAVVMIGSAVDGPIDLGTAAPISHMAAAVARVRATCPIADATPPAVTLTCTGSCRNVAGSALDDPIGRGVKRVLLGVERITSTGCAAWDGRRFVALPCGQAATRLVAVRTQGGKFRVPALGSGRFVVRAVAIDRAGNRSRLAVRRVSSRR